MKKRHKKKVWIKLSQNRTLTPSEYGWLKKCVSHLVRDLTVGLEAFYEVIAPIIKNVYKDFKFD